MTLFARLLQRACVLVLGIALTLGAATARADFQAGIASVDVTPTKPMGLSAGLGTPTPTKETKGKLEIRALVLADGPTNRVAIVSVPFIGFPGVLAERVRAKVKGVKPDGIMIGSTHTHSAPDMYAFLDEKGKLNTDLDYIDFVCDKAASAIDDAAGKLRPATLRIATDKAKGKISYNYYAPQLYDPRVHVLQAIGADGKPFATLVNYAVHPEILIDQGIMAPDLVGPLVDRVAEKGGGMGIFMNGAQGGMVTADCRGPDGKDIQTWDECIRIGQLLADEALRVVSAAPEQKEPKLWYGATSIKLPVDNPLFRLIIKASPLKYKIGEDNNVTTQLNVVNVGSAQMLTIPGEALPNIGYYLKRKMFGDSNFLFGLTNDAFGYMMVKEDFNSFDRYEYISRTALGENAADLYVEQALAFVNASPRPVE